MSWIGNLYDHFHDDLKMPELPGMNRDRVQEIVAEAFAPGSPAYHHLRQNSQVAEFLLPGLDLNFEENYSDFYDDLVGDRNTDGTPGSPHQDGDSPPPQGDVCPPEGDVCPPPQGDECPPEGDDCPPPQGDECPPEGDDCPPPQSDCPPLESDECPPPKVECPPESDDCPPSTWTVPDVIFPPYNPDGDDEDFEGDGSDDDRPEQGNDGDDTTPDFSGRPPLEGGRGRVEIKDGQVPQELAQYASYENGMLVIDGRGEELPPLQISSDNMIIRNARIKGNNDGPAIRIDNSDNVQIEDCEISGGTRGVQAWYSSDVSVRDSWLHDFDYREKFDTTAVEFNHVSGGTIEGNRINGLYRSDAVSMYESQNVRAFGNRLDITIDEWSSAPLMVEGRTTNNIQVYDNVINYPVGNNVPPGLLGGTNLYANNNEVNGSRSVSAWQMYAYNPVWRQVYFDGQLISPT